MLNMTPNRIDSMKHRRIGGTSLRVAQSGLGGAAMPVPLGEPAVATVLTGTVKPSSRQRNLDVPETAVPQEAWQDFDDVAMNR